MSKEIPELGLELCEKVKSVYNDKNFVIGILGVANHVDDRRKLIEFIDAGEGVDISSVTALATNLRRVRDGVPPYQFKD